MLLPASTQATSFVLLQQDFYAEHIWHAAYYALSRHSFSLPVLKEQ